MFLPCGLNHKKGKLEDTGSDEYIFICYFFILLNTYKEILKKRKTRTKSKYMETLLKVNIYIYT